jgi:hypothetical protein
VELEQQPGEGFAQLTLSIPNGSTACLDLSGMLPAAAQLTVDGAEDTVQALRTRPLTGGLHRLQRSGQ